MMDMKNRRVLKDTVERQFHQQPHQHKKVGDSTEKVASRNVVTSHIVKLREVVLVYVQHRHHTADSFQIRPDEQHFIE